METLDLTKILKGKEGIELYSSIFGKCILDQVNEDLSYSIIVKDNDDDYHYFTKEGYYVNNNSKCNPECVLFPSKEERNWENFNRLKRRIYYYVVIYPGSTAEICYDVDSRSSFDNNNFKNGNYFINKLDALNFKDKINKLFIDNKLNYSLNR